MKELKAEIDALAARIAESERECAQMKQSLNLLKMKFNDMLDQQEQERRTIEEQRALQEKREAQIRQAEETRKAEEVVREEITPEVVEQSEEESISAPEHQAIMRTIEELTKPLGTSAQRTTGELFEPRTTLAERASRMRLNDIKRGLGINERFLYANELFGGDMAALSRAIEELNHVESEQAANRLMDEVLAPRYQWDSESECVLAFRTLVYRRFA